MNTKLSIIFLLATLPFPLAPSARAATVQTLWTGGATGVDGSSIVGWEGAKGIYYNGQSFTLLSVPGALQTAAAGISGSLIVGTYEDSNDATHGFLYNGSTYVSLNDPAAPNIGIYGTRPVGIYGSSIVGYYLDASGVDHGFLYNGTSWTTLDDPLGVKGTFAEGIYGNTIVGGYFDASGVEHGFLYDGTTWKTIDDPASPNGGFATAIWGNTIVGDDETPGLGSYIYNGSSFTHSNVGAFYGISGDNIVGAYLTFDGRGYTSHAFLYTIPEPSTLSLLGLGACCLAAARRARNRASPGR